MYKRQPVRERWQVFLFGRLVLCGFRRQDVPAQVLLKLEGELVILLQTVEIGVGGGLFFLLLNDADSDVGAMIAHTLGIVQQIIEDEAELDGALAALEPPDVTAADLLRKEVHSFLQRFHLPGHLGIVRLEAEMCIRDRSRSMGVDSTERPTPAGSARMAMSRKAEEMMRSASAWSFRASAAAAKGIRLMVTG